ncbi:MAG: FKBP-type peptidyl-prolyl cis-trans isomerase [Halarcobacter sp.]
MAIDKEQVVSMMYELKIDGEVVDSNIGKEPLEFTFGTGQIIPGLENRISELNEGESLECTVPAQEAYGEYNPEAKQLVPKEQFGDLELKVGMPLQGQGEGGQPIQVVVTAITDEGVEVDFNHPLAGKDLDFSVTINTIL